MKTLWAWASVLALSVSPALAGARERDHERDDRGRGHSSSERRPERAQPRAPAQSRQGGDRRAWTAPQRSDPGTRGGWRSGQDNRRRDVAPRSSRDGGFSRPGNHYSDGGNRGYSGGGNRGYSDSGNRGYSDRGNRGYSDSGNRGYSDRGNRGYSYGGRSGSNWGRGSYRGGYRDEARWGGSYRGGRPAYPSYYRYGYFQRHGYYFPRYYFDYNVYPTHASLRVLVDPAEAEVYVDGYYAGVADDFDGLFQRLKVAPGRHEITVRLDGFLSWSAEVFATPGQTVELHHEMVPGASGSEPGIGPDPGSYEQPGGDEPPRGYEDPGPPPQD